MNHRTFTLRCFRISLIQRGACLIALALLAACGGGGGGGSNSATGPLVPGSSLPDTTLSTSGTIITADGTISGMITGGFVLDTGYPHGKIHVLIGSGTTISGPAPFVGENVSVAGSGSWSTSIQATSVSELATATVASPAPVATAVPQTIPIPSTAVSTQGSDAGIRTGGFTLDQGYPNGKVPVSVTASTVQIDGSPSSTGSHVQVTGTGSVHSGIAASIVTYWSSAPPLTTATGTIVAATAYGFTLDVDATHPAVPIVLNPTVVIAGGTLQVGSIAQVSGPGGISESITPTQIVVTNPTPQPLPNVTPSPTPGPIAQTHVLTADYLGGYYGTHSIAWSAARPYLNWASTNPTDANAIASTGIKTMYYTNPNRLQSNDPMYISDETIFAHDCNNNRITTVYNGITQYVTNVTSASLANDYHTTISNEIGTAHFDAMFEDDTGPLGEYGISPLPCGYTDSAWMTGAAAVAQAAPAPVIMNGLSLLNGHDPSPVVGMVNNANTIGGNFEHCYSDDSTPEQSGWLWQAVENTELEVAAKHALFVCMLRNTGTATTETAARIYATASFLLTYDPKTSVIWTYFATPSGLHVMPESQLVALNPKVAAPSSVAGLLTSSGAYGREYNDCYIAGSFVGPCAVAVNPNNAQSVTFPYPQYHHTLAIAGSSVLDGGTVAANGGAAPTTMAPLSAYIVFP